MQLANPRHTSCDNLQRDKLLPEMIWQCQVSETDCNWLRSDVTLQSVAVCMSGFKWRDLWHDMTEIRPCSRYVAKADLSRQVPISVSPCLDPPIPALHMIFCQQLSCRVKSCCGYKSAQGLGQSHGCLQWISWQSANPFNKPWMKKCFKKQISCYYEYPIIVMQNFPHKVIKGEMEYCIIYSWEPLM